MTTSASLLKNVLVSLPLGHIRPTGWLLNQLQIQANGLTGHLDEFWPDIADSAWIGGSAEGWERGPYWLDGLVPLAFLLNDEMLKGKVQRWMDYILSHQHEDGWLGPVLDAKYGYEYDPWPMFVIMKALTQYQEATSDARIIPAMQRLLQRIQKLLAHTALKSWAHMRSADLLLSIYWLYRHTGEAWLLALAQTVREQGYNWQEQYATFPYKERQKEWMLENHLVNHMMAMKEPAVGYQLSHNEQDREAISAMMATLETYHGQVTGMYTGDEVLAGKNPSQGTELCAVVEYMFSLEVLLSILGEASLADRLERIAFNALPATFKPDMWAHQYDQQVNQVLCAVSEQRVFATNRPEANLFGLEPNFGCCTANMHQGWPKFASSLWMYTADNGLAALSFASCIIDTSLADHPIHIEVHSSYPFEEIVQITVSAQHAIQFPLLLHIPAWTAGASITIDEDTARRVESDTFYRLEREWGETTTLRLHLPMPLKIQTRYHNSVSIERGPLVYALKINDEWKHLKGELPHADWEVHPASPWNYALAINREHPEQSTNVTSQAPGELPFSPEGAPIQITMTGRRVPQWLLEANAAGPLPVSPVTSTEPIEELTLIPYGCTNLRITEFPTLDQAE